MSDPARPGPYVIEPVVSAPFDEISYILWRKGSPDAVVVDPGFDPGAIADVLSRNHLKVAAILNTHGHSDHIAGNAAIKKAYPDAPITIGRNEAHLLTDPQANLSSAFGAAILSPEADTLVDDGEVIERAGFRFLVREIAGHSPGSVVYIAQDEEPIFVLGGDVLFAGSVGRVDFPGGSGQTLLTGIREKLFVLPDSTLVFPGHGPVTTIAAEKENNPFVGRTAGSNRLS